MYAQVSCEMKARKKKWCESWEMFCCGCRNDETLKNTTSVPGKRKSVESVSVVRIWSGVS